MNFHYFLSHLRARVDLDNDAVEELRVRVKELSIIKGSNLLYPKEVCKYIYFIKNGFFRIYTSDGFEDQTIDFACTGHFMTAIDSFFTQQATSEGIVCEEDAIVFRIGYHDWLALETLSPQFLLLSKALFQEYFLRLNYEKNVYRVSNAKQKYHYLGERYPRIANVVSQKNLASYLGITGPTLSNLLKEMLKKTK